MLRKISKYPKICNCKESLFNNDNLISQSILATGLISLSATIAWCINDSNNKMNCFDSRTNFFYQNE